jgi:hypothetical protein
VQDETENVGGLIASAQVRAVAPAPAIAVDDDDDDDHPADENAAPESTARRKRAPLGEVAVAAVAVSPPAVEAAPRMTNADILNQAAHAASGLRRVDSGDNKVTYGDVLAGSKSAPGRSVPCTSCCQWLMPRVIHCFSRPRLSICNIHVHSCFHSVGELADEIYEDEEVQEHTR